MALLFLEHFRGLEDWRVPGLVTYPLDEILLSTLSGLLSGADYVIALKGNQGVLHHTPHQI